MLEKFLKNFGDSQKVSILEQSHVETKIVIYNTIRGIEHNEFIDEDFFNLLKANESATPGCKFTLLNTEAQS